MIFLVGINTRLINHKDVKLSYGYDGTGSLYN